MGLTVSRKTANVRRKNERILTVRHKIRSLDLLWSLMCFAFMCSGSEN